MADFLDRESIWLLACESFEQACGSPDHYEHYVRSDDRVRGLNPWQIALVVKLAIILFQIWMAAATNQPSAIKEPEFPESFEDVYAQAQTYPLDHPEEDE